MDINQIENNIEALLNSFSEESFIYGLLAAYGLPNAAVTRLRNGEYNLSKDKNQILWKKRVCYQIQKTGDLHSAIDVLKKSPAISKQHPRFLIVTDFTTLLAIDTENSDSLDIPLKDLTRHFDFFLPWAGMEKSQLQRENPADIKAAERMGRLYDLILEENPIESKEQRHSLNVFFTRLLFCYFAEDTGIFPSGIFVNGIASHTSEDGSDLQSYLFKVFEILNQQDRSKCPAFLAEYPYVNGGLFATSSPVPKFNTKSRKILIECGALNWKAINPDIFGSMMQAVVHADERSGKGMHYTSVVNILKVIEPLFLNDLREELESAGDNKQKLQKLLDRIYNIRFFDPACGSGNFLIIGYKELCKLEIEIVRKISPGGQMSLKFQNRVKISQFYGVEIDDFAHEIAKLSLWLVEHQMNLAFREIFGDARPTLPLQDAGHIFCGNALEHEWGDICPLAQSKEIFILGNPPYVGYRDRSSDQKRDMARVLSPLGSVNRLDYVACWFKKASDYIAVGNAKFAFVTTNSICQGEQVSLLWPYILGLNLEIYFAHQTFKWSNSARGKAGVTCSIIGVRRKSNDARYLYSESRSRRVTQINPYLVEGPTIIMKQRKSPLSSLPEMATGSSAIDGGNLILSGRDRNEMISQFPGSDQFIRPYMGGDDLLNGIERYCLWIGDDDYQRAMEIEPIRRRIHACEQFRLNAGRDARKGASRPYRFFYRKQVDKEAIVLPMTSSERREYVPVGVVRRGTILSNGTFVIYDSDLRNFGILSSKMHMVWLKALSGKLESRIRYSVNLNYNTFPICTNEREEEAIRKVSYDVLEIREKHSELTLAELYEPDQMPSELRFVHKKLDTAIEQLYKAHPFCDDEERLEYLFKTYLEMSSRGKTLEGGTDA